MAAETTASDRAEQRWQRLLLPLMSGCLMAAAVYFGWTTLVVFDRLQAELSYSRLEPMALLDRVDRAAPAQGGEAYRDWAVRATLEQAALQQRFNVQVAIVKGRLWARFMGFLTGMLLALTGCVFVLGKLRTEVDFSGAAGGASSALKTSSPGVFLALMGSVIISLALMVQGTVEATDAAVFLGPGRAATEPGPAVRSAPAPLPGAGASAAVPPFPSPFGAAAPPAKPKE